MKNNVTQASRLARRTRAVLAAGLVALAAAAVAQEPDLARAEALVRAGQYAEAYTLLEPFEDRMAGDLKFDYLLARAALESGRPSKASFIYERILAVEPNYVGVRLEMGRAYLALNDYARARLEFETVLRFDNLPPDLREQAQIYARAADRFLEGRRLVGYGYAEVGLGWDSNPLSSPAIRSLETAAGPIPLPGAKSATYLGVTAGGEGIYALDNKWSIYAGGDGRLRTYSDVSVANYQSLDGRLGVGYADGRFNARLGGTGGYYWLDDTNTRAAWGGAADVRYLLDNRDQLTFNAAATRFEYIPVPLKVNNFNLYAGAAGWLRAFNEGRAAFGLTVTGGYEDATGGRIDGNAPFYGGRVTLQSTLTDTIGGFVLGGAARRNYQSENVLFETKRRDTLYDVTAGVTWSFATGWSLRPQVVYLKNTSNIDLYDYDRTDVSVNLRKDF
jgi:tetratricopeptide (TPR) repeat protein